MDTSGGAGSARPLTALFRPAPLPRWRAVFSITCAAAACLAAGGMLEYGAGSPETQGSPVAIYWALLFALHVVAFGGASLLAAFPALARVPVKLVWLGLLAAVYGLAFAVWRGHQPAATWGDWMARSTAFLPAALVVLVGLLLPPVSGLPPDLET